MKFTFPEQMATKANYARHFSGRSGLEDRRNGPEARSRLVGPLLGYGPDLAFVRPAVYLLWQGKTWQPAKVESFFQYMFGVGRFQAKLAFLDRKPNRRGLDGYPPCRFPLRNDPSRFIFRDDPVRNAILPYRVLYHGVLRLSNNFRK